VFRVLILLVAAGPLLAQSAGEIASRVIEAMGGADKFAAIEGIRVKGRMILGKDESTPFSLVAMRPSRYRMELTVGSDHVTQAYDGAIGWQSIAGAHPQQPTALTGESLTHLIDQAANAIGGPLLDSEKRHNQVELDGHESVNDNDCYRLKVTLGTGDTMILFVDATKFRVVQEELPIQLNGKPATIQQTVGDYRRFGAVLMPCLFITREKGREDSQRMEIDSVEINPEVDAAIFRLKP
jgi:hypothetical protein